MEQPSNLDPSSSTANAPDLNRTVFIYPEYIEAVGPLNERNVLEYFSHSPFFDRQSSNQVLKMQTLHTGETVENEEEELRRFTGIEFALVHAKPPSLFIIHKRERLNPDHTYLLAAYYIVNNAVYLAQSLHSLLSSRLNSSIRSVQTSLDKVRSELTSAAPFNPRFEAPFVTAKITSPPIPPMEENLVDPPKPNGQETGQGIDSKATTTTTTPTPTTTGGSSYLPFLALRTTLNSLPELTALSTTSPVPSKSDDSRHPGSLEHSFHLERSQSSQPPSSTAGGGGGPGGNQRMYGNGSPRSGAPGTNSRTNTPGGIGPTPPPTNRSSFGSLTGNSNGNTAGAGDGASPMEGSSGTGKPRKKRRTGTSSGTGGATPVGGSSGWKTPGGGKTPSGRTPGGKTPG